MLPQTKGIFCALVLSHNERMLALRRDPKLTADGEDGRGLHLAHAVLSDAGVGALVAAQRLLDPQQVVLLVVLNLIPGGTQGGRAG